MRNKKWKFKNFAKNFIKNYPKIFSKIFKFSFFVPQTLVYVLKSTKNCLKQVSALLKRFWARKSDFDFLRFFFNYLAKCQKMAFFKFRVSLLGGKIVSYDAITSQIVSLGSNNPKHTIVAFKKIWFKNPAGCFLKFFHPHIFVWRSSVRSMSFQ